MKALLVGALAYRPKLLVLDEPLSGLDTLVRDEVVNGLLQQAADTTILISSHELAEIESFTTHVAFMQNGRLLLQEAIEDLQARFREVHVTLSAVKELPQPLPPGWLLPNIEGHRLRFIAAQLRWRWTAVPGTDPALWCRADGMRADVPACGRDLPHAAAQAKSRTMNLRIVAAILKKDVRSLYPLILIVTLLFAGDVLLMRLDLVPTWGPCERRCCCWRGRSSYLAVFQLDPPASQVDDWLCRPVPRVELLVAKLLLLFAVLRLSQVIATLVIDLRSEPPWLRPLQRALLLHDSNATAFFTIAIALLPLLLITALVTRTLGQGLRSAARTVHLRVRDPHSLRDLARTLATRLGEALFSVGMGWLATITSAIVAFVLVGVACWLVCWRRRIRAARVVLVFTMLGFVVLTLLPTWLLPWQAVYAAQTALVNPQVRTTPDTSAIYLRNVRTCFAATRVSDLAADPAFAEARRAVSVRDWTDDDQADAGPKSVAFLTSIEPMRLPPDWRAG